MLTSVSSGLSGVGWGRGVKLLSYLEKGLSIFTFPVFSWKNSAYMINHSPVLVLVNQYSYLLLHSCHNQFLTILYILLAFCAHIHTRGSDTGPCPMSPKCEGLNRINTNSVLETHLWPSCSYCPTVFCQRHNLRLVWDAFFFSMFEADGVIMGMGIGSGVSFSSFTRCTCIRHIFSLVQ